MTFKQEGAAERLNNVHYSLVSAFKQAHNASSFKREGYMATYKAREVWLAEGVRELRKWFKAAGYTVPQEVRVSCGLPSSGAFASKRTVGEAWSAVASRDKHHEIFVSPTVADPVQVLGTLAHELVHVTVGIDKGHKGEFVECARKLGFQSPWTSSANQSEDLPERLNALAKRLGEYPHGALMKMTNGKKKQTTRLIKAGCASCGYTVRASLMWLMQAIPSCPVEHCDNFGKPFEVVLPTEDEGC
jgi:hypothetical protein